MLFKKKNQLNNKTQTKPKPKFFDTTWAEKCLEDHIIQSTQCLDLSRSEFIAYMTSKYLFLKWVYKLL